MTFLSTLEHSRSSLDVTESGAKGAAATSTAVERTGHDDEDPAFGQHYFEVDHPFVFLVWDYYSGMVLLMGRVLEPQILQESSL